VKTTGWVVSTGSGAGEGILQPDKDETTLCQQHIRQVVRVVGVHRQTAELLLEPTTEHLDTDLLAVHLDRDTQPIGIDAIGGEQFEQVVAAGSGLGHQERVVVGEGVRALGRGMESAKPGSTATT
jgi:hypothetical protein